MPFTSDHAPTFTVTLQCAALGFSTNFAALFKASLAALGEGAAGA